MKFTIYRDASPSLKFAITLLLCLTSFLLFYLIGSGIVYSIYGYEGLQLVQSSDLSNPKTLITMKILQVSQSIGLFIVPSILLAFLFSEQPYGYLGFRKIKSNLIFLSILLTIFALPAINLLGSLNMLIDLPEGMDRLEEKAQEITKAFMATKNPGDFFSNIIMIALLPALGEELLFRGILQRIFSDWTKRVFLGIIISATLFSLLHLQFQGFIPRLALGLIFGYLYYWSGSLWVPITTHFVNNFVAIIGYTLMYNGSLPPESENIGGISQLWPVGVISLIAVIGLMKLIRKEKISV